MGDVVLHDPALASALADAGVATVDDLLGLGGDPALRHLVTEVALDVGGTVGRFHLKRYHYPGWGRSRHLIGRGSLVGTAPEVNEFRALARLREHGVPAVRPVAAASRTRRGRLVAHALLTEHVPDAIDLATRLAAEGDPVCEDDDLRCEVLRRVAHALASMHAIPFVHRDAHARNVLVRLTAEPEVYFLDCRRGGPPSWRHGPLYDLATLDSDLENRVGPADRDLVLSTWLPEGATLERTRARVARIRERLEKKRRRRGRARR